MACEFLPNLPVHRPGAAAPGLANAVDVETRELWRLGARSQVIYL